MKERLLAVMTGTTHTNGSDHDLLHAGGHDDRCVSERLRRNSAVKESIAVDSSGGVERSGEERKSRVDYHRSAVV